MDIIAAFRWDSSSDKSISYMIIDKDYQIRTMPVIIKTSQKDLDSFKKEAEQAIQSFFEEIEKTYRGNNDCLITIEYKIVGNASPASHYHTQMHKPSNRTEFVRSTFFDYFQKAYQLQLNSLPGNHPDFAETFQNFAHFYVKKNDLDKGVFYYEKRLENPNSDRVCKI